jgi:hypothetical protein
VDTVEMLAQYVEKMGTQLDLSFKHARANCAGFTGAGSSIEFPGAKNRARKGATQDSSSRLGACLR